MRLTIAYLKARALLGSSKYRQLKFESFFKSAHRPRRALIDILSAKRTRSFRVACFRPILSCFSSFFIALAR